MITHHPDNETLLEHSAGTLSHAISIAVAAHLQMCLQCRQEVHNLNDVGGALLESVSPRAAAPQIFQRVMAKIEQVETRKGGRDRATDQPAADTRPNGDQAVAEPTSITHKERRLQSVGADGKDTVGTVTENSAELKEPSRQVHLESWARLPQVVRQLLPESGKPRWKRPQPSLRVAQLSHGSANEHIFLMEVARGSRMPEHNQKGRELMLVLSGQFSDQSGLYLPGDFLVKEAGEMHRPVATLDQPCLCLCISEGQMAPTNFLASLAHKLMAGLPPGRAGQPQRN